PRQLLGRAASDRRVFYVEEPRHGDGAPRLDIAVDAQGVRIVVPIINSAVKSEQRVMEAVLLQELLDEHRIDPFVLWYYTPTALAFTHDLTPSAVVFDCMEQFCEQPGA